MSQFKTRIIKTAIVSHSQTKGAFCFRVQLVLNAPSGQFFPLTLKMRINGFHLQCDSPQCFIFYPYPGTFFHCFQRHREGEKRNINVREKNQLAASCMCPDQDETCNPGMCPVLELNPQQPFSQRMMLQLSHTHCGQGHSVLFRLSLGIIVPRNSKDEELEVSFTSSYPLASRNIPTGAAKLVSRGSACIAWSAIVQEYEENLLCLRSFP